MNRTHQDLADLLQRIDGRGYKAYKEIRGTYRYAYFDLFVDHVQGDPFATPSRVRVRVARQYARLTEAHLANAIRTLAAADFVARRFSRAARKAPRVGGSGKSGLIFMERPGQEVLERNTIRITDVHIEARFFMGLPAQGRRIAGRGAVQMFREILPGIVQDALKIPRDQELKLKTHLNTVEDAADLRNQLSKRGLVAFVGNGARLPRASGIDPAPLTASSPVLFQAPDSLAVKMDLPHAGAIEGMGIPAGVTLIVGGGYHGKSTLLSALELGIYNHLPGDGREQVVTIPTAVKVRAADGRSIVQTDISPFIDNLPLGQETRRFSTANASGSTSQAAGIMEAIEAGAGLLLMDEDTSATNFMIRDSRMQRLVAKTAEPITPFVDRVRQLYTEKGVSTILVMGGSGDYFPVADHVIQMDAYRPRNVTAQARAIAHEIDTGRRCEASGELGAPTPRYPLKAGIDPRGRTGRQRIKPDGLRGIQFGRQDLILSDLEQLVCPTQTRALGLALAYAARYMDGRRTLRKVVDQVLADIAENGLDLLQPRIAGNLAAFRSLELAMTLNRLRSLEIYPDPR